ncbi:MAG: cytosine permease [Clostridiales bacterium]|uniref:cytosine permease n=1 Tax=Flavonifractor porci TaxID=3133422 RepID=UPI0030A7EB7A|nr:cytosine permease [Clostridiales bacterium]
MSKSNQSSTYGTDSIRADGRKSWVSIFVIMAGMIFAVSKVVYGGKVGTFLPLSQAFWAILLGNVLLTLVTIPVAGIGADTGLGVFELVKYSFGQVGGKFIIVLQLLVRLGWAGIGTILVIELLSFYIPFLATPVGFAIAGILINLLFIVTVWTGFDGLSIISKLAVPLILVIFVIALFQVERLHGIASVITKEPTDPKSFFFVVNGIFFSWIGAVINSPNTHRFARSRKDSAVAIALAFVLCAPIVYGVGAITSLATGYGDVPNIFNALGLTSLSAVLVLLLTWTTNSESFYSTSLGFTSLLPIKNKAVILLFPFCISTVFTLVDLYSSFMLWVDFTGFIFCPVIGVLIADYYGFKRKYKMTADKIETKISVASVVGIAVGIATNLLIPLYGAMLGIVTSALAYYVMNRFVIPDKTLKKALETSAEEEVL